MRQVDAAASSADETHPAFATEPPRSLENYDKPKIVKLQRRTFALRFGNSKWGARNLQTGAPSDPFASGRTHQIELVAYGFLKIALPSHSDRIADITVGPSRAIRGHGVGAGQNMVVY
jgi:hypothetical protein